MSTYPGQGSDEITIVHLGSTTIKLKPIELESLMAAESRASEDCKKYGLPTLSNLHKGNLGRPSKNHSFTQEASFETVLFQVMKIGSQYMTKSDKMNLCSLHPLIGHLSKMIDEYAKIYLAKYEQLIWIIDRKRRYHARK